MKIGQVDFSFKHNRFEPLRTLQMEESVLRAIQDAGYTHGYRDDNGELVVKQGDKTSMQVLRQVGENGNRWAIIYPRPKRKCDGCKSCTCKKED